MKKLMITILFFSSFNLLAQELRECTSHCVQMVGSGEVVHMQTLSAKGLSMQKAWRSLRALCQDLYPGSVSELMKIEKFQGHYETRGSNFWYWEDIQGGKTIFSKDSPNKENCPMSDFTFDEDISPLLG